MDSFRAGLTLLAGLALLAAALAVHAILLETVVWTIVLVADGGRRARAACRARDDGPPSTRGDRAGHAGHRRHPPRAGLSVRALPVPIRSHERGALLAVRADDHDAQAPGQAGARRLLPRSHDAGDGRALRADGASKQAPHGGVLRSDDPSRAGADARRQLRRDGRAA